MTEEQEKWFEAGWEQALIENEHVIYSRGYDDGERVGYEAGYDVARELTSEQEYDRGYDDGHRACCGMNYS